jgi:hypothetical protein
MGNDWKGDLETYLNKENKTILEHFEMSREKYERIWQYYELNMPSCIKECSEIDAEREGPQGIYWIGKNPEIFFVGRENFGWDGALNWRDDAICYGPLLFSYHTISAMGGYWGRVKRILFEIYLNYDFAELLQSVAFSNGCKCLSYIASRHWNLYENCLKRAYVRHEIETVNAPVNVLFTQSYGLIDRFYKDNVNRRAIMTHLLQ